MALNSTTGSNTQTDANSIGSPQLSTSLNEPFAIRACLMREPPNCSLAVCRTYAALEQLLNYLPSRMVIRRCPRHLESFESSLNPIVLQRLKWKSNVREYYYILSTYIYRGLIQAVQNTSRLWC